MSAPEVLRAAVRALLAHRLRTMLSLLGMTIGVAAVVALTALGEGARRYVADQFTTIGSNILVVVPGKTETAGALPGMGGAPEPLTLADAEALLRRVAGIERLAPLVVATDTVAHLERRRQVAVVGANAEYFAIRQLEVIRGTVLPQSELDRGAPVVVLGSNVAHELFPASDPLGGVVRIGGWRMRVVGVLESRGVQLGMDLDEVAVVPVATAIKMFDRASLFRIVIQARELVDLDAMSREVSALVASRHRADDVTLITQDAVLSSFSRILLTLNLVVGAIAAISLAVAGIGIMNVMLVSVAERTSEVGLLRAIGAHRRQVLVLFLTEAVLLSACGAGLGLLLGWLAIEILVTFYPVLPAAPPWWAVLAALGTALAMGTVFGVLPARRASRLDPVNALASR